MFSVSDVYTIIHTHKTTRAPALPLPTPSLRMNKQIIDLLNKQREEGYEGVLHVDRPTQI